MSKPCTACSSQKFSNALSLMLKRGIKVHRDLGSCKGCAADRLLEAARNGEQPEGIIGAAFFTKLDSAAMAEASQRRDQILKAEAKGLLNLPPVPAVRLWLSYVGPDGKPDPTVGAIVAECIREAGLRVDFSEAVPSLQVWF